jgi:hypothetical protein
MRFTAAQKVIATSAAALGVVLGAAGISAAVTDTGSAPAPQQTATDQGTGDFTPANEQGKPEPADTATEAKDAADSKDTADANDPADGKDTAASEKPDTQEPAGTEVNDTPAATTSAPAGQG